MANPTPPQLDAFLGGLRTVESGGNYTEPNGQGAYQILQSNWPTWALRYAGYKTTDANASDAPPVVQDEVARGAVTADYYGRGGRDWTKVAEIWNGGEPYPVPNPALGKGATTADYAARVLAAMGKGATVSGGTGDPRTGDGGELTGDDWITALDGVLNPDIGGVSWNPLKDASEVGKYVELVGARVTIALVGIIMFGGGLLLAFGRDIFGGAVAAAPVVGEAAGAAEAVRERLDEKAAQRRARGAATVRRERKDDDEREAA